MVAATFRERLSPAPPPAGTPAPGSGRVAAAANRRTSSGAPRTSTGSASSGQQGHPRAGRHHLHQGGQAGGAKAGLARAARAAHLQRLLAQAVTLVEHQHLGAGQGGDGQGPPPARERVPPGRAKHEGILADRHAFEVAERRLQRQQGGVEPPSRRAVT